MIVDWGLGGRCGKGRPQRGTRGVLEVMEMFIILAVVIVSWVYANVNIHQIVQFLFYVHDTSIKL